MGMDIPMFLWLGFRKTLSSENSMGMEEMTQYFRICLFDHFQSLWVCEKKYRLLANLLVL